MLMRILLRSAIVVLLAFAAVTMPGCTTTGKARSEMPTGDTQVAHERHASGLDSQTADKK